MINKVELVYVKRRIYEGGVVVCVWSGVGDWIFDVGEFGFGEGKGSGC
jgi:hypothetical protein